MRRGYTNLRGTIGFGASAQFDSAEPYPLNDTYVIFVAGRAFLTRTVPLPFGGVRLLLISRPRGVYWPAGNGPARRHVVPLML